MITWITRSKALLLTPMLVLVSALTIPNSANASVYYGYDPVGRITTALYDNGLCTVYVYDANGNRTSQTSAASGPPGTPTWGTGVWGCFSWTP
jgi:YD repeat-containing protein